ncbi:phytoene/squalene synthase family protein [Paramicrobacterium sp. CJ85]|uniref:phytoene/squalene synthase family protein n=1 Tax=Paramicrobacterium sp. CJ85 TaxID=3445355 RepID=UPI003F5DF6B3
MSDADALRRYTRCARSSSARVIDQYSTSFGLATRMFDRSTREHIRAVYGLVRVADEIVDGAAAEAGLSRGEQQAVLDALEREVESAIGGGYSANLVVHAFTQTARDAGIDRSLTAPFFASMRRDLDPAPLSRDDVDTYIYGSAEVVGLMCLRVFLMRDAISDECRDRLEVGARHLGAAFQKINFLRDLAEDWNALGRNYFPGIDPTALTEDEKCALLDDIDQDLDVARTAIGELPRHCRVAVSAAHAFFSALSAHVRSTPASDIMTTRVRVPTMQKAAILLRVRLGIGARA